MALNPEKILGLLDVVKGAFVSTPQHLALEERLGLVLGILPDWCVTELRNAARVVVDLAQARLDRQTDGR